MFLSSICSWRFTAGAFFLFVFFFLVTWMDFRLLTVQPAIHCDDRFNQNILMFFGSWVTFHPLNSFKASFANFELFLFNALSYIPL